MNYYLPIRPCRLVDRLAHIERFRETLPCDPEQHKSHLKASVLHRARHAVIRPFTPEGDQMTTGLEDSEGFDGPGIVPRLQLGSIMRRVFNLIEIWHIAFARYVRFTSALVFVAFSAHRVPRATKLRGRIAKLLILESEGRHTILPGCVPLLPHKLQAIRRIGDDRVHGVVSKRDRLRITLQDHASSTLSSTAHRVFTAGYRFGRSMPAPS